MLIQYSHINQFQRRLYPIGYLSIGLTGLGQLGRMVVRQYGTRRIVLHGRLHQLTRVNGSTVDSAGKQRLLSQQTVLIVSRPQHDEDFALEPGQMQA